MKTKPFSLPSLLILTPPAAVAGQPEEREYRAIAVLGDEEAGVPSDIVSAVFRP